MVLVQHVRSTCFNLAINDSFPQFMCLDDLSSLSLIFVRLIELLKLLSMALVKSLGLIGAEKSPITIVSDSLHK